MGAKCKICEAYLVVSAAMANPTPESNLQACKTVHDLDILIVRSALAFLTDICLAPGPDENKLTAPAFAVSRLAQDCTLHERLDSVQYWAKDVMLLARYIRKERCLPSLPPSMAFEAEIQEKATAERDALMREIQKAENAVMVMFMAGQQTSPNSTVN